MTELKIDTGWSIFDIDMHLQDRYPGYTVPYGDENTLLNISMSNSGEILDLGLIYIQQIRQEETSLPDRENTSRSVLPPCPDPEDAFFRWPLWVNLPPRKRQLELIFARPPFSRLRAKYCCRDGRVEFFFNTISEYDEETDEMTWKDNLVCIKVLELTEDEYEYFRRFV